MKLYITEPDTLEKLNCPKNWRHVLKVDILKFEEKFSLNLN